MPLSDKASMLYGNRTSVACFTHQQLLALLPRKEMGMVLGKALLSDAMPCYTDDTVVIVFISFSCCHILHPTRLMFCPAGSINLIALT